MQTVLRSLCVFAAVLLLAAGAAAEPVVLELMTHYSSYNPNGQVVLEAIEEYERLHPDVKIEFRFVTNDVNDLLLDRILVGLAAGTAPDIVHIAGYMLGDLAAAGALDPLPEHVYNAIKDKYVPGAFDIAAYDGIVWGYPTEYMPRALVFNKNLLSRAGLPLEGPATWAELRDFAAKLTEFGPDGSTQVAGFGVNLSSGGQAGYGLVFSLAYPMGARFLSADGRRAAFNTPEVEQTLLFLRDLVSSGFAFAREWLFVDENLAIMVAPGPYWKRNFLARGREFYESMGSSLVPVPEAGMTPAAGAGGWLFSVMATSKHKEIAYDFLTWLNTEALPDGTTRMGNALAHIASIPVTYDDLMNQETMRDPFMAGFVAAVANGYTFPDPVVPGVPDMYIAFEKALRESVLGVTAPANALAEAEQRVQALLDDVYKN